jgi:hypothetical protein
MNTNHIYTFEALLVAADAHKRAKTTDPKALAEPFARPTSPKTSAPDRAFRSTKRPER